MRIYDKGEVKLGLKYRVSVCVGDYESLHRDRVAWLEENMRAKWAAFVDDLVINARPFSFGYFFEYAEDAVLFKLFLPVIGS